MTYKTLRLWVKNSSEAIDFLEEQEEENLEAMNQGYSILMGFAPEAAETLISLIRNPKTKDYVRKDLTHSWKALPQPNFSFTELTFMFFTYKSEYRKDALALVKGGDSR